jgi:transcriptional regulator, RpiR family
MRVISMEELQKAIEAIINARHIEIYGVGASGYTALDVMYKFKRIGLQVNAYIDPHIQSMSASLLQKNDVALAISFSGSTRDTVDTVETAKKSGATVICITNHGKSPIAKLADVVLLSSVRETPLQSGALSSKIAHLHIADLLYTGVTMKIKEKAVENINKTAAAVLNKLY